MIYNEEYYKQNNYTDYSERAERYYHLAKELYELLDKLSLIKTSTLVFDYGCAFGFLMEGFKKLGVTTLGYDISDYARGIAKLRGNTIINQFESAYIRTDITLLMDVLEHMTDIDIKTVFNQLESNIIICRIPCSHFGSDFWLEVSRRDPTHVNCKSKDEWKEMLRKFGYTKFLHLNLNSIYDSNGVFSFIAFKN